VESPAQVRGATASLGEQWVRYNSSGNGGIALGATTTFIPTLVALADSGIRARPSPTDPRSRTSSPRHPPPVALGHSLVPGDSQTV
jgi:hypothetical protein